MSVFLSESEIKAVVRASLIQKEGLFTSARGSGEGSVQTKTGKSEDGLGDLALMPDDSTSVNAIHPDFWKVVDKIQRKLNSAEGGGFKSKIGSGYRSAKSQQEKIDKGYSKSPHLIGWHTSLNADGSRAAYAVDLVHKEAGWSETKKAYDFFEALGKIVNSDEFKDVITWGGNWEPKAKTIEGKTYTIGWDPAHIQWKKITRAQIEKNTLAGIEKIKSSRAVS